jgi:hypothetical protein
MSKEAVKALTAARELLSKLGVWITMDFARDLYGHSIRSISPDAVQFCSLGAIRHIDGPGEKKAMLALYKAASQILKQPFNKKSGELIGNALVVKINDSSTNYLKVLAMFDRAIKIAKKF